MFGYSTDMTQNTTFAPLANVTINGSLDVEEINDRLKKAQYPKDAYYIANSPVMGDISAFSIMPGDIVYTRKGYNNVTADGLIKVLSSFNGLAIPKKEIQRIRTEKAITSDTEAINDWIETNYVVVGVAATESFLRPDKNDQTQKPAIYVAGVVDLIHNNIGLTDPIQVGSKIMVNFPKVESVDGTKVTFFSPNKNNYRPNGVPLGKITMVINTLDNDASILKYINELVKGVKGTPSAGTINAEKMKFIDKLSLNLTNQIGTAYSNANFGQKFNLVLSNKTLA